MQWQRQFLLLKWQMYPKSILMTSSHLLGFPTKYFPTSFSTQNSVILPSSSQSSNQMFSKFLHPKFYVETTVWVTYITAGTSMATHILSRHTYSTLFPHELQFLSGYGLYLVWNHNKNPNLVTSWRVGPVYNLSKRWATLENIKSTVRQFKVLVPNSVNYG